MGVLLTLVSLVVLAVGVQEPSTSTRAAIVLTGTVERLDRFSRAITIRTAQDQLQTVNVGREVKLFDELKTGDRVTVHLVESVIVAVRPNAKPTAVTDTTTAAKNESDERTGVVQQLKATVVIDSVDETTGAVTYTDGTNRRSTRVVADRQLLAGLKPRDVIEITYTRARVVDLQRQR
jgi:hypothetical protein